jgi:formyl-CoA transferase
MPRMWPDLCQAIERDDMAEDPRFDTREARRAHRKECNSMIAEAMVKFTTEEMLKRFAASDIPSGPVFTIDQAFDDPQVRHMALAKELSSESMGDFKLLGQAFRLSRTPTENWSAIPEYGENTEEILAEFGFSGDEIAALISASVVTGLETEDAAAK